MTADRIAKLIETALCNALEDAGVRAVFNGRQPDNSYWLECHLVGGSGGCRLSDDFFRLWDGHPNMVFDMPEPHGGDGLVAMLLISGTIDGKQFQVDLMLP